MENAEGVAAARLRTMPSRLINLAAIAANRLADPALDELGARRHHYALLATLAEFGPASQATLGRRTGIDRSDIVTTINDLVDRALVDRDADPVDRRRNIVRITAAGTRNLGKLDRRLAAAHETLLADLTSSEREQLVRLLTRIVTTASTMRP